MNNINYSVFNLVVITLIKKIINRIINENIRRKIYNSPEKFTYLLINLCHNYNLNIIIYWIWVLKLKNVRGVKVKNNKKVILVFNSPGGLDDIRAAYENTISLFRFKFIDTETIKCSCNYFLGDKIEDYNNGLTNSNSLARSQYQLFLKKLILYLQTKLNLVAIINFNHVYYAQIDFAKVANELNIPFLTLLKECLRTPAYNKSTELIYRERIKKIESTAVSVHNEETRDILINSGIIEKSKVFITGQGRSDVLFKGIKNKKNTEKDKIILFFSISNTAGLPYFGSEFFNSDNTIPFGFSWEDMTHKVWDSLVQYMSNRSRVKLIVKGKPNGVYSLSKITSNNIIILNGNPSMDLFKLADVVVGFNTTALVESIASKKPTISTNFFSEDDERKFKNILFDWEGIVEIVRDSNQLALKLDNYLFHDYKIKINENKRFEILNKYLGNPDGNSGVRIRNFINNFVHNS